MFCDKKQLISLDLAAPAFEVSGSQSFFMERHPNNNTFRAYREDMYKYPVVVG